MGWRDDLAFRLGSLWRRGDQEQELDDELQFHLEMDIERRIEAGATPEEASRAARLAFGGPESVKEACREAWGTRWLDEFWWDCKSAGRQLLKSPTLSLVVLGSLAVGLGAAAVIISLVDAVLLRPLPYGDPRGVVAFEERTPEGLPFSVSHSNLIDYQKQSTTLDDLAGILFPAPSPSLERDGTRTRMTGHGVTPNFFQVLGVEARLGRTFGPDDAPPGSSPRVVLLTDEGWKRHFNGDPDTLGQEIDLDGELFTVLGILPEGFRYRTVVDVFLPFNLDPEFPRGDRRITVLGRLAPEVTIDQAQLEIDSLANQLAITYPESNEGWGAIVSPIDEYLVNEEVRRTQWLLLAAVGLLLLLVAVNVSNLLLARGDDRLDEMRLRLALGAGRGRVIRQLLTESLFFGLLGTLGAIALAALAIPWVRGLDVRTPRLDTMVLDVRSLVALGVIALLTTLFFGWIPALRATSVSGTALARARRQGPGVRSQHLRRGLIVLEVALATVLTVGAGLLLDSFAALKTFDSGITEDDIVLARIDLPKDRYSESSGQTLQFSRQLIDTVSELPGVSSATLSTFQPYEGPMTINNVADQHELDRHLFTPAHWRAVTSDYFRTFDVPLLRGDTFEPGDRGIRSAVISSSLASRLWPGEEAVGRQMRWISPEGPLIEVVGVAAEVQDLHLGDQPPMVVYVSQDRMVWPSITVAAKTESAATTGPALRQIVTSLDPMLAPPPITTLEAQRREALASPLLSLRLVTLAAMIAVLLSAVGVYGMVAYAIGRRRRELGVRSALGARSDQLVTLVMGEGTRLVGLGLVVGLLGAWGAAGFLRAQLYETSPTDPQVLAQVAGSLLAIGLIACIVPALRAARIDPVTILREE